VNPQARPKVSVVIPVWNGAGAISMVLSSLREQTTRDFDVWVVDNGSTDGTVEYVKREWPEAHLIALEDNVGYAVAANQGIAASSGEFIAFLNDDMELEPQWLDQLSRELAADAKLGVVTSKVLFHHDRDVIYQAGFEYYTYGWCATRGAGEKDVGQHDTRQPSVGGTGAGSIWRRAAIEHAGGGFDGDYFMYCEEVDLGLQVLMAGYQGLYVPSPVGYHVGGGKTGKTPEMPRGLFYRNQLITLVKDVPAGILVPALPKALLYLHHQYRSERQGGSPEVALRAYLAFLKRLPSTLLKRRRVMRSRKISNEEYRAQMRSDYPFPTPFARLRSS
jgi:GT2 family glycosyltransferase